MKYNPPGFLTLKGYEFEIALNEKGKTVRDFADALNVEPAEAYGLLSGKKAGPAISRKLIKHYGADFIHKYIDWWAMGTHNPYPKIKKRHVLKRHYDRRNAA